MGVPGGQPEEVIHGVRVVLEAVGLLKQPESGDTQRLGRSDKEMAQQDSRSASLPTGKAPRKPYSPPIPLWVPPPRQSLVQDWEHEMAWPLPSLQQARLKGGKAIYSFLFVSCLYYGYK